MTDENERKPFYKRNWFWITILSIFVVVSATTYVANFSFYQGKADQVSNSQSKNVATKKAEANPSLVAKYNSIKTGKEGLTKTAIIRVLGQPTTTQNIDESNQVMSMAWEGFDNSYNHVISILGDPDNYSDTNGVKTLTYESDLAEADPSATASIKLEVSNNAIISKDQQNLK